MELYNLYDDPNQETSPPQSLAHHPQEEPPLPQEPSPQSIDYSADNSNDKFKYSQQSFMLKSQENNMNNLDKGCFKCYKVVLYIILAISIMTIVNIIAISIQSQVDIEDLTNVLLLNLVPAVFIVFQLQAIDQRNLLKAKIALTGFVA